MSERRTGVLMGLAAYGLWGLFPLYFPLLEPAGGVEIVAHRIVWSLLFVALLLTALRGWSAVRRAATDRRTVLILAGAAVLITGNWLTFVIAVNSGHVVETSLGYFINPLVSVLLGVCFLGERLRRLQWVAVGTAAVAVGILTVEYGRPPWIAILLAGTFATYGLLKKLVRVDAAPGLFLETLLLVVPALVVLVVLQVRGASSLGEAGAGHVLLLMTSGIATAIPLLLFAASTRRIPLSTVGLLQYLTPLMQLAIGVYVNGEPMPPARLAGFVVVWLALAIFTVDGLRANRAARAVRRGVPEPAPAGL